MWIIPGLLMIVGLLMIGSGLNNHKAEKWLTREVTKIERRLKLIKGEKK